MPVFLSMTGFPISYPYMNKQKKLFRKGKIKLKNVIIKDTLEAWQPHYEKPLEEQEGLEIQNNLVSFSKLLNDWHERSLSNQELEEIA